MHIGFNITLQITIPDLGVFNETFETHLKTPPEHMKFPWKLVQLLYYVSHR